MNYLYIFTRYFSDTFIVINIYIFGIKMYFINFNFFIHLLAISPPHVPRRSPSEEFSLPSSPIQGQRRRVPSEFTLSSGQSSPNRSLPPLDRFLQSSPSSAGAIPAARRVPTPPDSPRKPPHEPTCPVCFTNYPGWSLVPCGHSLCQVCAYNFQAHNIRNCFLCRQPYTNIIEIFQ